MSVQKSTYSNNNKKKALLLVCFITIVSIIVIPGCASPTKVGDFSSKPASRLNNASRDIDRSVSDIEASTDTIDDRTDSIMKTSDDIASRTVNPEIKESVFVLKSNANEIKDEIKNIRRRTTDIADQNKVVDEASITLENLENDLSEYENEGSAEAKKKLYNLIIGMSAFGGLSILGGIILFIFNPKIGLLVSGFGLLTSVIAIAGIYYLKWIAIWGISILGIGLLVTLAFIVYTVWKARIYRESHESNVKLIEEIKEELPEEEKKNIFRVGGVADTIQPKRVQKEVMKTRKKAK